MTFSTIRPPAAAPSPENATRRICELCGDRRYQIVGCATGMANRWIRRSAWAVDWSHTCASRAMRNWMPITRLNIADSTTEKPRRRRAV